MKVIAKVRRFVRQHDLLRPDTRVVCALSGGSDSVALAALLQDLDAAGDVRFVGLTHLNHQLRPTADRDEQFCRDLAARLDRPILAEREAIEDRAARDGRSVEAAAHDARYALFARARAHFAADRVAVAHTRDDQAETFLLRLLRGAGPRGLAGIWPRHGEIVRPLLDCSRAELQEFLGARGWSFVDDETNADVTIPRNRVRAELLPRLAADFNPNIVEVLAREADLARDVWSWLENELERFEYNTGSPGSESLDVDRLAAAPPALRRLAIWRALTARANERPIDMTHVDAALGLLCARDGAGVDAPGVRVHRKGPRIVLTTRVGSSGSGGSLGSRGSSRSGGSSRINPLNQMNPLNPMNYWQFPLSIPGEVTANHMTLSAELRAPGATAIDAGENVGNGPVAAVRADLLKLGATAGLAVRNRRPGDRFRPVGLGGRKKVQDLFVDSRIARGDRDSVPIVVDDRDRIVWVAGHGIDEAFRVTDPSQAVVVLKLRYLQPVERCS